MSIDLDTRDRIRKHVIETMDAMFREADQEFGPPMAMTLVDEIHAHFVLLILFRVLLRRYGVPVSILKDSLL